MKKYKLYIAILLFTVLLSSCTDDFEEINTDPNTIEDITLENARYFFANAEFYGSIQDIGTYNIVPQANQDVWVQYFAPVGVWASDRFNIMQWFFFHWDGIYVHTLPLLNKIINVTEGVDMPANAVAKIWKVYSMHILTDLYGPIPYSEAGKGQSSIPYDSQESIYNDFFNLLDEAITALKAADPSLRPFGADDMIYQGDIGKWIKFGNSLRLRLAMRISYVNPTKAKTEAEKAVASGVMLTPGYGPVFDDAMITVSSSSQNPLNFISDWNSMCMSAAMESYLKGYSDPRMFEYYSPNKNGLYHGMSNGLSEGEWAAQPYTTIDSLNNVGPRFLGSHMNTNPFNVMYTAESYFLRAEGALNGWNMGGSAKQLYEEGIKASMAQWGINDASTINDYINSTSTPIALSTPFTKDPVSDIPVAFSSDPAEQLQQIITQKWIAIYPDACEAWSEIRRTGFPKIYPIANPANPDIAPNTMIRRIPFLIPEKERNAAAVEAAITLLGGEDKASTRVWWNVNK